MGKLFTKTHLFSCPIYRTRIDRNLYDKEKIINDILYNKNLKNTRNDTHQIIGSSVSDTHHSYLDFDNENFRIIDYEKLVAAYHKIFEEFFNKELNTTKSFEFEFEIVNYSAITEGQWLPLHEHIGYDFATVHYLNFKKDHNQTMFKNPAIFAPFIKNIQPKMYSISNTDSDNSYLYGFFTFPVKEDDMVIFPAALEHEIAPQGPTKEPRITISTNIKIK